MNTAAMTITIICLCMGPVKETVDREMHVATNITYADARPLPPLMVGREIKTITAQ